MPVDFMTKVILSVILRIIPEYYHPGIAAQTFERTTGYNARDGGEANFTIKTTMKITALTLFSFFLCLIVLLPGTHAQEDIVFLCPPCGMECDTAVYKEGGTCGHCGMRLIAGFRNMKGKSQRGHFQHIRGKSAAILLFQGVEIIDFAPEFEIFGQAGMRVFTVAEKDTIVTTAMGMRILPDYHYGNAPAADLLLIPGGSVDHTHEATLNWIRKASGQATNTLSVCNGAFFLAAAGLLEGKEATTFNASLNDLRQLAPGARIVNHRRYVDNGKIITSAGLAAGIDAAFHLLGKYEGVGRAQEVATFLEYNWDPEGKYVRALLADRHVRPIDDALAPFMVTTRKYEGDRDQWTLEVVVSPEMVPIEGILRLIEHQWTNNTQWQKTSFSGKESLWSLKEGSDLIWRGRIQVNPEGKNYLITISVEREKP